VMLGTVLLVIGLNGGALGMSPVSSDVLCKAYPPQATPACRDCMDDACEDYFGAVAACGGDSICELLAKLRYELQLLTCTDCLPVASVHFVIGAIPQLRQDWILATIDSMR
jgi:hypothetical protein